MGAPATAALNEDSVQRVVSAPYDRFCSGIRRSPSYDLQVDGDRLFLTFHPWFVESDTPTAEPCLRLTLRRVGNRVVLEGFSVGDDGASRDAEIEAGRDAFQAWMDSVCD